MFSISSHVYKSLHIRSIEYSFLSLTIVLLIFKSSVSVWSFQAQLQFEVVTIGDNRNRTQVLIVFC